MNEAEKTSLDQSIIGIVDKAYEHRTPQQHSILCSFLQLHFQQASNQKVKLISFFISHIQGPLLITHNQYNYRSYFINGINLENPEATTTLEQLNKEKKINIKEGNYALFLDYQHFVNCEGMGETTIQQEITFMQSSQFLSAIPRKRFYHILRNSKVFEYSTSQNVYKEGQKIEPGQIGSGIYLARKGQFCYYKLSNKQLKQIQVYRFSEGHLFGTIQSSELVENNGRRAFTLKCKSSKGTVYNFGQDIFISLIKPYCEHIINIKQAKLIKYLDGHLLTVQKTRQAKTSFLSQTFASGFMSTARSSLMSTSEFRSTTLMKGRPGLPTIDSIANRTSLPVSQQKSPQKSANFLHHQNSLKNIPASEKKFQLTDIEFREFKKLEKHRDQCKKIKVLKGGQFAESRGEVLFSFFKNSWQFEKEKRLKRRKF